jgi:Fe-S-cluster containining protein
VSDFKVPDGTTFVVQAKPSFGTVANKYTLPVLPEIDCASRLELCKARCCTLLFSLSKQDLDERVVKFDYDVPFQIRQHKPGTREVGAQVGYCVHNNPQNGCDVYSYRPAPCRLFDCRGDRRIWLDFEARVPAP